MEVNHEGKNYGMNDLIPLNMESSEELHMFKLTAFCLTSCHSEAGLNLKVNFISQNVITDPGQKQYGVFQSAVAQTYKFTTVPYSYSSDYPSQDFD